MQRSEKKLRSKENHEFKLKVRFYLSSFVLLRLISRLETEELKNDDEIVWVCGTVGVDCSSRSEILI